MVNFLEEVITIVEVFSAIKSIADLFDNDGDGSLDGSLVPQEVVDVLDTFTDGEQGNNDVENILVDIKQSLMYDEEYTSLSEISARMEVIDKRLDTEFEVINDGLGLIITCLIAIISWKFFGWLLRLVSV